MNHSQSRLGGWFDSIGGVLEFFDGGVDLEHVSKMLGALDSKVVPANTAKK